MINLTRLNGQTIVINVDLIKYVDSTPDTKITFINGDVIIVKEKIPELVARTIAYKRAIFSGLEKLIISEDKK
ncbi:MAG: flagellar FlbD family protein [Oligoflexia bacterium]|nr:flagellar FlbD family protein [Oligoflexia bacterium]